MDNAQTPNESRRRFLRQAALTGIGLAATPLLLEIPAEAGAPSVDDQKKLGDQAARDILKKYKEVFDGRARHFDEMGRRLVAALPSEDRKRWDYRFHVLDSKEINAFALPGGNMFMFTGLYEKLDSDDAMAAVTGHEMTHVRKQHWARATARQQERDTLLSIGLLLFRAGRTAQTLVGLGDSIYTQKFSRGEEAEADAGGLQNMVDAGYNPEGMIHLFQTLQKVSGNGGFLGTAWLSDHPLTTDRIKAAQQQIAKLEGRYHFPPLTPLDYPALLRA